MPDPVPRFPPCRPQKRAHRRPTDRAFRHFNATRSQTPFVVLFPTAQVNFADAELLSLFGSKPVMAHMVKTGQLTLKELKEAEEELLKLTQTKVRKETPK